MPPRSAAVSSVRTLVVPDRHQALARRASGPHSPRRCEALGVQRCSSTRSRADGWNVPSPTCSVTLRDLRAARAAPVQHLRREVQARGGRRHRAALACEDGLVALAVGRVVGALDVRRQRHVPDRARTPRRGRRRRGSGACARRIRRAPRSPLPGLRRTASARRCASCGPAAPAPCHTRASAARGRSSSTSTSPLRYSCRFGLFLPMGSECTPARWPYRRAGNTRESFNTRQSPGRKELGQVAKPAVFPALRGAVDHQHARAGAVRQRLLRDQLLGQVEVEERKIHPDFTVTETGLAAPRRPTTPACTHGCRREAVAVANFSRSARNAALYSLPR